MRERGERGEGGEESRERDGEEGAEDKKREREIKMRKDVGSEKNNNELSMKFSLCQT